MSFEVDQESCSGKNYYGSIAQALCYGPIDTIYAIYNGETSIYEGPLNSGSADEEGKTSIVTSIGILDFYWGSATQNIDPHLEGIQIDFGTGNGKELVPCPAYRNICYFVGCDLHFGENSPTPPSLYFELGRKPAYECFVTNGIISRDYDPVAAIWDLLIHPQYGLDIDSDLLDSASFILASQTLHNEDLFLSILLDTNTNAREVIGTILSHVDGYLIMQNGKIHLRLNRALSDDAIAALQVINEEDLLEEPDIQFAGVGDVWSETIIKFCDADNSWEETSETFPDFAIEQLLGESRTKQFNMPYCTTHDRAARIASRIGSRSGFPPVPFSLTIKPRLDYLRPGDCIKLTYAKLNIALRVLRITDIEIGNSTEPQVKLQGFEEYVRDWSNDYIPESSYRNKVPHRIDQDGTGTKKLGIPDARFAILPDALLGSRADGWLLACGLPDKISTKMVQYLSFSDPYSEFSQFNSAIRFPVVGQLIWWKPQDPDWSPSYDNFWIARIFLDENNLARFIKLMTEKMYVYAVTGHRISKLDNNPSDQHQVVNMWGAHKKGRHYEPILSNVFDISIEFGQYSSVVPLMETAALPSQSPTTYIYFGEYDDFFITFDDVLFFERDEENEDDVAKKRYGKAILTGSSLSTDLATAPIVKYERANTNMNPLGSLIPDWGGRALTMSEYYDIVAGLAIDDNFIDIDITLDDREPFIDDANIVMGNSFISPLQWGDPNNDWRSFREIDGILGRMLSDDDNIYNLSIN